MRRYIFIFILLYLIGAIQSCQEKDSFSKFDEAIINVPVDLSNFEQINFDEFLSLAEITELELTPESGIDVIKKVVSSDNSIYLFNEIENTLEKSILKFDRSGRFLRRWNANEPGPPNFQYLSDFTISNDTMLKVLDRIHNSIVSFSVNGDYLGRKKINVQAFKFVDFADESILTYRGNSVKYDPILNSTKNLMYVNEDGDIQGEGSVNIKKPLEDKFLGFGEFFFPVQRKNAYLFSDVLNDTIFFCDSEKVIPKYIVDFSNKAYTEKKLQALEKLEQEGLNPDLYSLEVLDALNDPEVIIKIETILPGRNGFLAFFRYKTYHYFMVFNQKAKASKLFQLDYPLLWPLWYAGPDEIMMVVTSPLKFKNRLTPEQIIQIGDVYNRINEISNPLIIKINLEKFR